jgi:hypothetical protein
MGFSPCGLLSSAAEQTSASGVSSFPRRWEAAICQFLQIFPEDGPQPLVSSVTPKSRGVFIILPVFWTSR